MLQVFFFKIMVLNNLLKSFSVSLLNTLHLFLDNGKHTYNIFLTVFDLRIAILLNA